jgi:transcriptional regulator with XRE-family HTH domain
MNNKDIRLIRMRMHLTQQQLADLLNMDRGSVIRWESGKGAIPRNIQLAVDDLYRHWAGVTGEEYPLLQDLQEAMREVAKRKLAVVEG